MSDTLCIVPVPGPAGEDGADGASGTNGVNAFTTTTAQFTMPAEAANVTITVGTNAWAGVGQIIYIEAGGAKGYFEVISKTGTTQMSVQNIESTASSLYAINSAPGTVFAVGATVSPGGLQGPAGTAGASGAPVGATYIVQTPDATLSSEQALSALATGIMFSTTATGVVSTIARGTANTNIAPVDDAAGLTNGEMLRATATGIESVTAATGRTALGVVIGTDVQAFDATLTSIAALGTVADRYAYTTNTDVWAEGTITSFARTLLDDADAATLRNTIGVIPGYGLLASSDAVDLNSATTDTAVTVNATRYLIDKITLENVSAALALATMGIFTAAGGGGVTLCADQGLAATLTATTKIMHLAKQAIVDTDLRTNGTLYIRVGTADGAARTVNVKIYGWKYA